MPTDQRERLARIRRFDQLVAYLRDELGWPIDSDDFEELTFEYTPEELGIDAKNAAKIQEIKRLRPLVPSQPWGIFFVKFEPKRLPVVALRRILGQVALKKRASANKSERQAWAADDLLFVSNYGEGGERRIAFAHFSKPRDGHDLPTLKVLGWDNLDTPLHLDAVARELSDHLTWPDDEDDPEAWRGRWRSAFKLRHREVITTSKQLSERLAELARAIRDRIRTVLAIETEVGPLTKLMKAFQTALVHDLDEAGFADMYAQTIAYGLLSARITDPARRTADDFAAHMRTNPFLRELMETFLRVGGRRGKAGGPGIDFDELGAYAVVELLDQANMEAVVRDFGDRNPQEDPVIHFYEHFLAAYDKEQKVSRGVFYTPRPVVSYIVRSVDTLLRSEFGLADGLADTTTWREMAKRHKELKIPEGTPPGQVFVQILDPATGTGTFLVEVIDLIHKTMVEAWMAQGHGEKEIETLWNEYVPKHLLPRLHGYELLMAPYAIAHLKIGLKLYETGYRFGSDERARVYLTNALEPVSDMGQRRLEHVLPALAHEAQEVNEIKRLQRFTVVIGNPPYSVTSTNTNLFIDSLMEDYKAHVSGERGLVALADDYLKFIRFGQELLRASGGGLWGMITNHGYLKGVIHRGIRIELLKQFPALFVLDLHGDTNVGELVPRKTANQNVFDIQQGVAITIGAAHAEGKKRIRHLDCWGSREEKYETLSAVGLTTEGWLDLRPRDPEFFLIPYDDANVDEFRSFPSLLELMPVNSCGVKTHRDKFLIDYRREDLIARFEHVASEADLSALRTRYGIRDTVHWRLEAARKKIASANVRQYVRPITYRPFDNQWIYYNPSIIEKGDSKYPTLRHMLHENRALLASRLQAAGASNAIFVTRYLAEMKTAEATRSCTVFPLYLSDDLDLSQEEHDGRRARPNLNLDLIGSVAGTLKSVRPDDLFNYTYAILHSPNYRYRYSEFLRTSFPRLPLTENLTLFRDLVKLGGELVALHLMESPVLDVIVTTYTGPKNPKVGRAGWSDGTVWLDAGKTSAREGHRATRPGTIGFQGVPEGVWDFHIGGYQICHKWLKDRKGRTLADEDIAHYQKIVVALSRTIRIMAEIDEVVEAHGGWPDAFQTVSEPAEEKPALLKVAESSPPYRPRRPERKPR